MAMMTHEARWTAEPGPALLETTVGDLLDRQAAAHADREFLVCRDTEQTVDVRWTYAELKRRVDAVARGLIRLGIGPGDKVGVLATNVPEWLLVDLALPKIGAVLVTVNTHVRLAELRHILAQGELKALILMPEYRGNPHLENLRSLLPGLGAEPSAEFPHFRHAIVIGGGAPAGTVAFDSLSAAGTPADDALLAERQAAVRPDDVWQIQFTSGTTGAPKGAMLTHRSTINNAMIFGGVAGMRTGDRLVSAMPLFHTAGNVMELLGLLVHGGTLVKAVGFDTLLMLELIHRERPTIISAVPTMLIAMMREPRFLAREFDTSSLRLLIAGGTAMPVRVLERVKAEMGADAVIGFGMTELSPMVSCTPLEETLERKSRTVGRPLPHIEVKIVDGDGRTCAHSVSGELLVRGFGVMAGYYREPAITARTIDAEGWLHSGDLANLDADGVLSIDGRLKDMIKRGGENVYPAEVENVLMQHPKVSQAQVVGVPDEYMGEESAAFIQVRDGQALDANELADYCRLNIARYKLPKYFRFVTVYPLTPSGKVKKYALRESLLTELEAAAARA